MTALPALAAAALLSPTPSAQDDSSVRHWYDVRDILAASAAVYPLVDSRLHLTSAWIDQLEPDAYPTYGLDAESLTADALETTLEDVIAARGADVESIRHRAGRFVVDGSRSAHAAVVETLAGFRDVVHDRRTVEVYRVPEERIPDDGRSLLGSAAAERLLAGLQDTLVARESFRIGHPGRVADIRDVAYLQDYDVEVAQFAANSDPVVSILHCGVDVGLRIERASDDARIVLRTWGRDGELDGALRVVEVPSLGESPIELPRMRTSSWTASAILEPGGALVLDHDGGGAAGLIVRVLDDGPKASRARVALGELVLPPMRPGLPDLPLVDPSQGRASPPDAPSFARDLWEDEADRATYVLRELRADDRSAVSTPLGSELLFHDAPAQADVARRIRAMLLEGLAVSNIEFDVRYAVLPLDEARALREPDALPDFVESATGRLRGSAVEGDALRLIGGTETAHVQDHDVQIAQAATIADPILHGVFEGVGLWCTATRAPDGRVAAWFDVQWQRMDDPMRDLRTAAFVPSAEERERPHPRGEFVAQLVIELPILHRATTRTQVIADPGAWTLLCVRRIAGTENALVVAARTTAR